MSAEESSERSKQRQVLAKVAALLVSRRLTAPGLFILETTKPLSFLASQALIFLQPIVQTFLSVRDYETFAAAIEDRDNIEWLIQQLEAAEECGAGLGNVPVTDEKDSQ